MAYDSTTTVHEVEEVRSLLVLRNVMHKDGNGDMAGRIVSALGAEGNGTMLRHFLKKPIHQRNGLTKRSMLQY